MTALKDIRDWLFPMSLFTAWTVTTAYTLMLVAGSWAA